MIASRAIFTRGLWLAPLLAALAPAGTARAGVEAQTLIRQYDDGETKVTSPSIDVIGTFGGDQMKIGAGYTADILTSASSDVRTYGSKGQNSKIDDYRREYNGMFEAAVPDGTLGLGYVQSDEDDYHSRIVSWSGSREFFQKNTVVGIGFSNGQDRIESVSDKSFREAMTHQVYSLSLTQVLSKVSLLQFIHDLRVENGFIASPYRRAKTLNGTNVSSLPENHPRTRNRNAFAVKYNRYLESISSSWATTYRYYTDSWGVQSHTVEERLTRDFGKTFAASFLVRYYTQTKAKFFKDYYDGTDPGPFYTGNTTLGTYDSILFGLRPAVNFTDKIGIFLKYEYYLQTFKNVSDAGQLSDLNDDKKLKTNAQVIGLGLTAKF